MKTISPLTIAVVTVALAGSFAFGALPHSGSPVASAAAASDASARDARAPYPSGDEGKLIAYGHDIVAKTPQLMGSFVKAGMSCEACHNEAGRKAHAGSLLGVYAKFPQWNKRSHRFIALQDRLAECFLYSMNGRPPTYDSREMIALTAYIAFLSRGAEVGTGFADKDLQSSHPRTLRTLRPVRQFTARSARRVMRPTAAEITAHFRRCGATARSTMAPECTVSRRWRPSFATTCRTAVRQTHYRRKRPTTSRPTYCRIRDRSATPRR